MLAATCWQQLSGFSDFFYVCDRVQQSHLTGLDWKLWINVTKVPGRGKGNGGAP